MDQHITRSHCPTTKVQVLIDKEEARKTAKAKKATKKAMNAAKRKQKELQWENIVPLLKRMTQVFTFADTFLWVQPPTSEFAQLSDTATSNGSQWLLGKRQGVKVQRTLSNSDESDTDQGVYPTECDDSLETYTDQGGYDKEDANGSSPISSGDEPEQPLNADALVLLPLNVDALVLLPLNADALALLSSPAKAQTPTPQSICQTWTLALRTKSGSYPDMVTETNWAKAAWKAGCKEKDVDMVPNVNHLRIIICGPHRSLARSGHLRGDVKTKAKDAVANLAELKRDFTYVYRMECALDEWRTGSYSPVAFTVADYKHVFEDAHEMLQSFNQATKDLGILPALQKAIFTGGCVYGKFDAEEGSRSHQNSLSEDAVKKAIEEHQNGIDWSNDEDVE
ncbi:hypothetical protein F5148DRAFT_1150058 [Russula earlei]|uniref:Uncharacterized protein n=1 Tax=Russula earlei TaxID=71964 RepID=A0ACC0U681_9AGAM|nr:hypothetical protein F5148DRAFT_1150058 [Russula earlei]